MSANKTIVEQYMNGFRAGDHQMILACLHDGIEWIMPGYFHHRGKTAFDMETENDAFRGKPAIQLFRLTEEKNVVIAEGAVQCSFANGSLLDAVFCDVFEFRDGLIVKLTTYQVNN